MQTHNLAAIAIGPLLLAQGIYVRWITPQLPEPPGPRAGSNGAGQPLRLLIAGDSAAAGVGADTQASALSGKLVAQLAAQFDLHWQLQAQNGRRLVDLLQQLECVEATHFDVAVVSIGVNDVTGGTAPRVWAVQLLALCKRLAERFAIRHIVLSAIPPMQAFPALPAPLNWYLGRRAAVLNAITRELVQSHHDCDFIEAAFPLQREFAAADGFHPSPLAYTLWAQHLAETIRQRWA